MARSWFAGGLACALVLAACSGPPAPAWTEVALPMPAGTPGSLAVLDAANCDGHWYVVGGVRGTGDATRPAAWTSTDTRKWHSVPFEPLPGSYYGPQDLISSVGCSGERVAMIGAKPGGAHGNPRVSTWRLVGGKMAEVSAPFDTYGGDRGVNVAHVVGGPDGFLITGNRTSGAAVWLSADGTNFRIIEDAPGLASDATHQNAARDAVAAPDGGWVIVGGSAPKDSANQEPAVWLTTDGSRFTREAVPSQPGYNELQRGVRLGDDIVATGPRGSQLGAWRKLGQPAPAASPGTAAPGATDAAGWRAEGTFGSSSDGVQSLAVADGRLIATSGPALWISEDRGGTWRKLKSPAGAGDTLAVAGGPNAVLVTGNGHVWIAPE